MCTLQSMFMALKVWMKDYHQSVLHGSNACKPSSAFCTVACVRSEGDVPYMFPVTVANLHMWASRRGDTVLESQDKGLPQEGEQECSK